MPAAPAAILLAFDLFEHKLALDDVDKLAVFAALAHFGQRVAAARADFVGLIELKPLLLHPKIGLGARATSAAFLSILFRLGVFLALLRGGCKLDFLQLRQMLFDRVEFLLKLRLCTLF